MLSRRVYRLLPLLVCLPLLNGCGLALRIATQQALKNLSATSSSTANTAYIASLKPLPSGNGLIVLDPVATSSVSSLANWGSGVSRWLQVHVAGQGELGKTPTWGVLDNVRRHLGRNDLRLSGSQALGAGRIAGVTHIMVGELSGSAARPALRYEVRTVADNKKVGEWKVTGTLTQIESQLPVIARRMAQKLGVKTPQMPARLALSPTELAFLGSQPIKVGFRQPLPGADATRLKSLLPKDALVGVMAQRLCEFETDSLWQDVADTLVKQAPRNALIWGEVAGEGAKRLMTLHTGLEALSAKYPNNYLLARGRMSFEAANHMRPLQVQWAETSVRAAPQNVIAWIGLSQAQNDAAQEIRKGKYSSDMTMAESSQVNAIYPKFEAAGQKATQVDPMETFAWSQLATGATFNGDDSVAETALQQAIALDVGNQDAWGWGMQMKQPKWGGSVAEYKAWVQQAAQNADKFQFNATSVTSVYTSNKQRGELKPILQTVVQKDPQNVSALMELGAIYHYEDRAYRQAETLYRQALAINPNDGRTNSSLGDLTYWVHHDVAGAEALYLKAIAADPTDGYFHANLGRLYALTGRQAQAVAEAQQAKALNFSDKTHPVWGATGVNPP